MSVHEFNLEIPHEVKVVVTHFIRQDPMWNADNPDDYYGYIDCDWHLEDQNGNKLIEALDQQTIDYINECIEDEIKYLDQDTY
jgi:hypothetical protein